MIAEFASVSDEYCRIIQRINRTNARQGFDAGTLADAVIERDRLGTMQGLYQDLATASGEPQHRHLRSELKSIAQMRGSESQKLADGFGKERRELDVRIQAANWTTPLAD
jgi:hypothetical protein